MSYELEAICHHEAGHACVARALGLGVTTARIGDVGQRLDARAAQARVLPQVGLQLWRSRAARAHFRTPAGHRDLVVVSFGGPVSESRYRNLGVADQAPWWTGPWRFDLENLHRHVDVGPLAPLRDQAEGLVADLWPIIERVAEALLQHGVLSGDQIDALL